MLNHQVFSAVSIQTMEVFVKCRSVMYVQIFTVLCVLCDIKACRLIYSYRPNVTDEQRDPKLCKETAHTHTHTVLTNQLQLCVSVCYVEFTLESVWPYGIKRPILTSPPHLSSWDPAGKTQWAARAQQQMCVCERQRECMHARVYYTPSTSQEHKDKTRTLYDPKRRRHVHSRVI